MDSTCKPKLNPFISQGNGFILIELHQETKLIPIDKNDMPDEWGRQEQKGEITWLIRFWHRRQAVARLGSKGIRMEYIFGDNVL